MGRLSTAKCQFLAIHHGKKVLDAYGERDARVVSAFLDDGLLCQLEFIGLPRVGIFARSFKVTVSRNMVSGMSILDVRVPILNRFNVLIHVLRKGVRIDHAQFLALEDQVCSLQRELPQC